MSDPATPPAADPAATPPAADPAANKPWYDGADAEAVGYLQNRGWADKTPAEVALLASAAHRQAEKFIGVPADQIARVPTDPADEAGWKALWTKLGAPGDATKYDLSAVKLSDGTDVGDDFRDFIRSKVALPNNMPPQMAAAVAKAVTAYVEDKVKAGSADQAAARIKGEEALAQNWGANKAANEFVANQGIAKSGLTPAVVDAMKAADYANAMETFRKIGSMAGEDRFVNNANPAVPGVMTREAAIARKGELMADQDWAKKYTEGGTTSAQFREMQALLTIIVGDDTQRSQAA